MRRERSGREKKSWEEEEEEVGVRKRKWASEVFKITTGHNGMMVGVSGYRLKDDEEEPLFTGPCASPLDQYARSWRLNVSSRMANMAHSRWIYGLSCNREDAVENSDVLRPTRRSRRDIAFVSFPANKCDSG